MAIVWRKGQEQQPGLEVHRLRAASAQRLAVSEGVIDTRFHDVSEFIEAVHCVFNGPPTCLVNKVRW